jgi:hypothetical protein
MKKINLLGYIHLINGFDSHCLATGEQIAEWIGELAAGKRPALLTTGDQS